MATALLKPCYHRYIDCRIVHLLMLQKFSYIIRHGMNDVKMVTGGLKFHFESLIRANLVYQTYVIHSLACAEYDDFLPFSGASFISLCCVLFPSTQFHHLVFHPSLLHLAIYFLVYLLALLFPNSYLKPFLGILFSSILCTCPNQHNLCSLTVSAIVGFLTTA